MSYRHIQYDDILQAPPPPRISTMMVNEGVPSNPLDASNSKAVAPMRDDSYKPRQTYDDRLDRKHRYDDTGRDRKDRSSYTSRNESRRYDGWDGRDNRRDRDDRESRDDRGNRYNRDRDRDRERERDRDNRSGRRYRSRSRSRSPYSRHRRHNDSDYSRSRRKRSRSSSRDRRGRRRSKTPDRHSRDNRTSNSSSLIYRSKPLVSPSATTSNQSEENAELAQNKITYDTYSEYDDNSNDEMDMKQIHKEMEERLREHLAREGKVYPPPKPQPAFVNDGSFLERFKQMQEQQQQVADPEPEPPKPSPMPMPMVAKRRGGKILKTGVVQKKRPTEENVPGKGTDAWSQYLREVQQYKNVICDGDANTRCLVK